MNILHIDSSPRATESNSRALTEYLISQIDGAAVVRRDLASHPLPQLTAEDLVDLHGSRSNDRESFQKQLALSEELIAELKAADTLVLGVAMHNFSIPAVLKQWIDRVCRAGHTFHYTENGPEGLTNIQHAYIVVASGGTPIGSDIDFASGYLKWICQFIGVKEIDIIDASGSKRAPEEIISQGKEQIDDLAAKHEAA